MLQLSARGEDFQSFKEARVTEMIFATPPFASN
jgi:hypothetical protein